MRINKLSPSYRSDKDDPRYKQVNTDLENLFVFTQSRIRFGDGTTGTSGENIAGQWVTYTSNAVVDTEDTIAHTMGSVPIGFIVVNIDKGGIVYDSGTAWTSTNIYLKTALATSATVTLFLLK